MPFLVVKLIIGGECLMNEVQFRGLLDFLKERGYHVGKDEFQLDYVRAMAEACHPNTDGSSNSVFLDAEAGTGKTTLATLVAVYALMHTSIINQIIYVRAEVDVAGGKDRGALPGNDDEKNASYQTPFIEALDDAQPGLWEHLKRANKAKATHPGHFRGITRKRTFIIIDEAQNMKTAQLKATYTRFTNDSVIVTIGHSGQCDLPIREQERVCGLLPFNVYAIHHQKKGGWVGTLKTNYRGEFARWSDRLELTIAELIRAQERGD
jgi:predicted ribonuclease YlaK